MIIMSKEISGLFPETSGGIESESAGRFFTSKDPLVGPLATNIDSEYPGMVEDVNRIVKDPISGNPITDFDIETDKAVIQVKSGGGKGLTTQMKNTSTATTKTVIAYGPKLKQSVIKSVEAEGFKVFTSEKDLIDFLGGL